MILERYSIRRNICAIASLSTIYPSLTEVGSNLGVLDKRWTASNDSLLCIRWVGI